MEVDVYIITTASGERWCDDHSKSLEEAELDVRLTFGDGCTVVKV